jgi:phosphoenolpyruvate-protein kinase (PTS system EI component)
MTNRYIIGHFTGRKKVSNCDVVLMNEYWYNNIHVLGEQKPLAVVSDYKYMFSHIPSFLQKYDIPIFFTSSNMLDSIKENEIISIDLERNDIILQEHKQENFSILSSPVFWHGQETKIYSSIKGSDSNSTFSCGADGIGLISTEFLFWDYEKISKDIQVSVLNNIFSRNSTQEYTIRLFDINNDKVPHWFFLNDGKSLFSKRGINLLLESSFYNSLELQIASIVELSKKYNISVLIPYINQVNEIIEIRKLIDSFNISSKIKLGVMIETVAAADEIKEMLSIVDFFSIGTNDLVQSYFGVDRGDIKTLDNIDLFSNEFIIFLTKIRSSTNSVETRLCGQLPVVPFMFKKLLNIGYRSFTVSPQWVQILKHMINDSNKNN